jgi:hypothetical protein
LSPNACTDECTLLRIISLESFLIAGRQKLSGHDVIDHSCVLLIGIFMLDRSLALRLKTQTVAASG